LKDVFAKHCLLEMGWLLDDNFSPFQWAIFSRWTWVSRFYWS